MEDSAGSAGSIVRRVGVEDWALLRVVRLAALTDAPYAFGSTHAEEVGFDEEQWRSWADGFAWFVAVSDQDLVGLAAGAGRGPVRSLFSMWTSEQVRGAGVAGLLVSAVVDWARAGGAAELVLWTADGNERARRFYRHAGFVPTGNRKQLRSNPAVGENELRLLL